jgi:cell division protein FtsB
MASTQGRIPNSEIRNPKSKGSWRLEARATVGILLVLALLGLLCWLCVAQASKVSTTRHRIWKKEAENERLQRKNAELLAEVMELASVPRLENMALGLGYVPPEERRYLSLSDYPTGVSGGGLAAAPRPGESAVAAPEEPRGFPPALEGPGGSSVARWWEKVISQFVTWARE